MLIELIPGDVCNALGNDKPPSAGRASIARLARAPRGDKGFYRQTGGEIFAVWLMGSRFMGKVWI